MANKIRHSPNKKLPLDRAADILYNQTKDDCNPKDIEDARTMDVPVPSVRRNNVGSVRRVRDGEENRD